MTGWAGNKSFKIAFPQGSSAEYAESAFDLKPQNNRFEIESFWGRSVFRP